MSSSHSELTQEEWARFKKGDERAFKRVFTEYYGLVRYIGFRCGLSETHRDDLVQDTFIRLSQNIDKIESKDSLGAWLSTTARNIAIDFKRRESREDKRIDRNSEGESVADTTHDSYMRELELALTSKFIDQVAAEPGGESFLLFYRDGMSAKQIAQKNDEGVSAVTTRLSRLRTKFGASLKEHILHLREKGSHS